jgi:DNA mismatch repair protein MutS
MSDDNTPIRQQYLDIKRQYPDSILFFRLGDFYETFDQDAEITARELDIVLTSRGVAKGTRIPMAGIPYHAVDNYLARLIEKGYHVAICEQVGDQPAKGIFPREVVRVVTPGTVVEPGMLSSDRNNYLVGVTVQENKAGIAYADITTGEFAVTELQGEDIAGLLRAELMRLHPAEILLPEGFDLSERAARSPDALAFLAFRNQPLRRYIDEAPAGGFAGWFWLARHAPGGALSRRSAAVSAGNAARCPQAAEWPFDLLAQ